MATGEKSPRVVRVVTVVVLATVFAAGFGTGAGFYHWASQHNLERQDPPPFPSPFMLHELHLTPEQEQQVEAIFAKHRPELDAILRESFPRVRTIKEKAALEIEKILTPEQQKRFHELQQHREQGHHHHNPLHGGPEFGPPPFDPPEGMQGQPLPSASSGMGPAAPSASSNEK